MNALPNESITPLFWDELEELLGPIFQPIVGPLFDFLRVDANRLFLLSTISTLCIFFVVVVFIAYELPMIFQWLAYGSSSITGQPSRTSSTKTPTRYSTKATSARHEVKQSVSSAEAIGDVIVASQIEKKRDEVQLNVNVTNMSEHQIEMVVVDLHVPAGIDFMTGSFRMQRLGTIPSGESSAAHFRLKHSYGSLAEISGQVEFMSSSYEITKVSIPSPQIE